MLNLDAEIIPSIGLAGCLLGQQLASLAPDERWEELPGIVRGSLAGGAVEVVADAESDVVIGLIAGPGYRGRLPNGVGVGTTFAEALQLAPQLGWNDLDHSLYEPDHLGYLLNPPLDFEGEIVDQPIHSILVCDWAHDYWTYRRPLIEEEDDAQG